MPFGQAHALGGAAAAGRLKLLRLRPDPQAPIKDAVDGDGDVACLLMRGFFGFLAKAAFGHRSDQRRGSPLFTHEFRSWKLALPSLSGIEPACQSAALAMVIPAACWDSLELANGCGSGALTFQRPVCGHGEANWHCNGSRYSYQ